MAAHKLTKQNVGFYMFYMLLYFPSSLNFWWLSLFSSESLPTSQLLRESNAIFVSFNYRLNVFGFLSVEAITATNGVNASGNYGLMDQIMALQWVQQNIRSFGGNPNNVSKWRSIFIFLLHVFCWMFEQCTGLNNLILHPFSMPMSLDHYYRVNEASGKRRWYKIKSKVLILVNVLFSNIALTKSAGKYFSEWHWSLLSYCHQFSPDSACPFTFYRYHVSPGYMLDIPNFLTWFHLLFLLMFQNVIMTCIVGI